MLEIQKKNFFPNKLEEPFSKNGWAPLPIQYACLQQFSDTQLQWPPIRNGRYFSLVVMFHAVSPGKFEYNEWLSTHFHPGTFHPRIVSPSFKSIQIQSKCSKSMAESTQDCDSANSCQPSAPKPWNTTLCLLNDFLGLLERQESENPKDNEGASFKATKTKHACCMHL